MPIPSNNRENRKEMANHLVGRMSGAELRDYARRAHGTVALAEGSLRRLKEVVMDALVENYRRNSLAFEWDWKRLENHVEWSESMITGMKENCPNVDCYCGACEV